MKKNPLDGSRHCARSDACILAYGHGGRCVVEVLGIEEGNPAYDAQGCPEANGL